MQRRMVGVVAGLLLVAVLAAMAMGSYGYKVGLAQGLADAGAPPVHAYAHHWHGPFFFGGPLVGLLFFLLLLSAVRGAWGGRRWAHAYGHCESRVPPPFEEWHRRAHESMEKDAPQV
jgi:hypothetical protein